MSGRGVRKSDDSDAPDSMASDRKWMVRGGELQERQFSEACVA